MPSIDASFDAGELCSVCRTTEQGNAFGIAIRQYAQVCVLVQETSEIDEIAVGFRSERRIG